MVIEKVVGVTRCDMLNCRKDATYVIGGEGVMTKQKLNLCENCAKELYKLLGSVMTPKSPQNHIKTARSNQLNGKHGMGGESDGRE